MDRSYKANCNPHDLNKLYAVSVCLSLCLSGYRYRIAFVLIIFFDLLLLLLFLLLLYFFVGWGEQKYIMTVKEIGQVAITGAFCGRKLRTDL